MKLHKIPSIVVLLGSISGANSQQSPVDFPTQIQPVFSANCAISGCHTGETLPFGGYSGGGLILSENDAYDQLVEVVSKLDPDRFVRVKTGEPDKSLLIMKLEGDTEAGAGMPLGESPLPDATIQIIRDWIAQGALRERSETSTATEQMSWGGMKAISGTDF